MLVIMCDPVPGHDARGGFPVCVRAGLPSVIFPEPWLILVVGAKQSVDVVVVCHTGGHLKCCQNYV